MYSYISSAAVRIGDEVMEVSGQHKTYYVNGVENAPLATTKLSGYRVTLAEPSAYQRTYIVHAERQKVVIKTWKDLVSVKIEEAQAAHFGDAVGLMGNFATGQLLSRDGTAMRDVNAFGQEWQVQSTELLLFQTIQRPQHPKVCTMPVASTSALRRRLSEGITEEAAKAACAHVKAADMDFCVFDVMATNDVDTAGAY